MVFLNIKTPFGGGEFFNNGGYMVKKKIMIVSIVLVLASSLFICLMEPISVLYYLISSGEISAIQSRYNVQSVNGISADYVEMSMISGYDKDLPFDRIQNKDEVIKLIEYMRKNNLNIAKGSCWLSELVTFEQMRNSFEFISNLPSTEIPPD